MFNDMKVIDRLSTACNRLKEMAEKSECELTPQSSLFSSVPSDDIKERVLTYVNAKWKVKPKEFCVRTLARHGWSCLDGDTLQCVNCKQYMNVSLPSLDKLDIFEAILRKINTQMVEGHQSTCAMRNVITKYPTISPADSAIYRQKIQARYNTLLNLNVKNLNLKSFDEGNRIRLLALNLNNFNAAVLACLGWRKNCEVNDTLTCDYCERNIGLWLFRGNKQLNGETEHQRWCAYVETSGEDCILAWERHLAAAVEPISRKRKLPATVELKEKMSLFDNLISSSITNSDVVNGNEQNIKS